ncbi:MAG: energy-coupling factor ABC transporter permease [Myxococcales bacterium]|nr:energy-coupling factor ABC transporter permease [Myxococcales bacterium]
MARGRGWLYVSNVHLADGILTSPAWLLGVNAAGAGSAALLSRGLREGQTLGVAFTGTLAAFVLAAQALNVPLAPGASAHVIGAGLLTLMLGPARAVLALVAVLIVQALLFADGGITTLGINVLDIAVIPVVTVHVTRRLLGPKRLAMAAVIGTLFGNGLSALCLAVTLIGGAGFPPALALGWLVGVQLVAGLVEGTLTGVAVRHVEKKAPALLHTRHPDTRHLPALLDEVSPHARSRTLHVAWAALALGIASALLPLASSAPDALERVVQSARPAP